MLQRNPSVHVDDFDALGDFTFSDALADVFTPPEGLTPARPEGGLTAYVQDRRRIRECFEEALAALGLEEGASR